MKLFLKNIVFNKHIKYKRYNIKFLNSIVNYFLKKFFPQVLRPSNPIILSKNNNFNISEFGIKIYSQNEEDGIILYILKHIGVKTKKFVEIGVENGTECNTTNLLKNFNWNGLQIEGNKKMYLEAKTKLKNILEEKFNNLKLLNCFITKNNINKILRNNIANNEVDLLSIDIDGNDFWIWKEINCIKPRLVVIEYNSFFGPSLSATIKYNPRFNWDYKKNKSYYGASLKALKKLGSKKKYTLVGVDKNGVNAFFVRNDLAKKINLESKKIKDIYKKNIREARNKEQYKKECKKLLKQKLVFVK
tara:strand:- start:2125 stop:3033 length:909 start_codon:yes stop_codon:yes gene_type:complete